VVRDPTENAAVACSALLAGIDGMIERLPESRRVARSALLVRTVSEEAVCDVAGQQQPDGGWTDAEETAWSCAYLAFCRSDHSALADGTEWLTRERLPRGGWGNSLRDRPRIPTTGLVLRLLGAEVGGTCDWELLNSLWSKDLEAEVTLSYKGGFYLMASATGPQLSQDLVERTFTHLCGEQNGDGGFGPWRTHPIGSDPWSTGICLVGICSFAELADREMVERAVEWLCKTQLPSGYWPYHFIDEGSAYAYWGLTEAIRFLELS